MTNLSLAARNDDQARRSVRPVNHGPSRERQTPLGAGTKTRDNDCMSATVTRPRRIPRNKPKTTPINPTKPLPVAKREIFAQYVARGLAVREAYQLAGYMGKDPSSLNGIRRAPDIDARVTWLLERRIEADTKARHKAEKPLHDLRSRVIRELERIAFSDARDVVQWQRQPIVDDHGNVTGYREEMTPTPSHKLKADQAAAVKGVTTKSGSLKIELHDKLAALDKLGRMLGLFQDAAPAAHVTVNQMNLNDCPDTALEAARRLAFALAIAEQAAIDAQPAVIKNEKAEAISAKQSD
jgi:Terminase small subunit